MSWQNRRFVLISALAILALAGGFRFCQIDRLPPGLHYDEAYNNLLALRLPDWEPFPVFFFETEFGRHVLHPYLIALLFTVTGPITLGGRLVSAFSGTMTVLFLFFTIRELFLEELGQLRSTALGLLASLSLAILYWHVQLSRTGMEPVMVPALAVPAFGVIWYAMRRQKISIAIAGGIILGIGMYTYPAALFIPLLLASFFGIRALGETGFLKSHWRVLITIVIAAFLVTAPLIHFFITHPTWLTSRSDQVWNDQFLTGITKVAGGLFFEGDQNPRHNLPSRPILDGAQIVLFILGLSACLFQHRPPHVFLLSWTVILSLPSALTEFPPHGPRMAGAAPAVATLVGYGAFVFYELSATAAKCWIPTSKKMATSGAMFLLLIAFAYSGIRTARDYFSIWAQSDDLFMAFDVGLRWIGEYVRELPHEERVYISPIDRYWKTLEFLFYGDPFRTHNFNGRRCVVYPQVTETATVHVVIVADDHRSIPALQTAFPEGEVEKTLFHQNAPYAVVYRIPPNTAAQVKPAHILDADFDKKIRLIGYDLPATTYHPGDTFILRLYWQAQSQMMDSYKIFVHVWGAATPDEVNLSWGQTDVYPCDNSYFTQWWAANDIVIDEYQIPIKSETQPGNYQLWTGWYQENGQRLPVRNAAGETTSDHVIVTTIQVVAP